MKRLISIVLCAAIWLSLLPGISVAADPGAMAGTGTKEDPYQIANGDHLKQFRDKVNIDGEVNACAILVDHIVFNQGNVFTMEQPGSFTNSDVGIGDGATRGQVMVNGQPLADDSMLEKWIPISMPDSNDYSLVKGWYNGIFDGQGYTISGLYCNYPTETSIMGLSAAALFCGLGKDGVIRNVGIVNSCFVGDGAAAIAVGSQGTIHGCYSTAVVKAMPKVMPEAGKKINAYAGGITAIAIDIFSTIERSYFAGSVYGPVTYDEGGRVKTVQFGGIVGTNGFAPLLSGTEEFKDNFYLNTINVAQPVGCTDISEKRFAKGEVAYKLNHSDAVTEDSVLFTQNLDNGSKDTYPGFRGENAAVNRVNGCEGFTYSNSDQPKNWHQFDGAGVCVNGCNKIAALSYTIGGETRYSFDFNEAVAAMSGQSVDIKLYSPIELDSSLEITSGTVSLDLAGCVMKSDSRDGVTVRINGSDAKLVVSDSGNGTGAIVNTATAVLGGAISVESGELFVESGTVQGNGGYAVHSKGDGYVEISGGTFISGMATSVSLTEQTILYGGNFNGIVCTVPISEILGTDKSYWGADGSGNKVDLSQKTLSGSIQITDTQPGDGPIETPTTPGETPTTPSEGPAEPTTPSEETTVPTNPGVVFPDAPEMETDPTPVVDAPKLTGIDGACIQGVYLVLDVDPLLGISKDELISAISVPGYEGYEKACEISAPSADNDKVRTSDRLTVSYKEGDKVVQSRTFVIVILGDTNCDGMAMANDAALMMKLAAVGSGDKPELLLAADLNGDGKVLANDAQRLIYRYYNFAVDYVSTYAVGSGG